MASSWDSITIEANPLGGLKPPLESTLQVLQAIEAILEALLDLLKIFALDLTNPLRAIIALLLAAIRAIINQIKATGGQFLLVHPDFGAEGLEGMMNSVSGAYPGFESKVVGKFYDTSDIFRPQFPPGSNTAMAVFYIGVDSPGDLIGLIIALLNLINGKIPIVLPPAPVDLKVLPITQSGNSIAQFSRLFDSDLDKALSVEWRMPTPPKGVGPVGAINNISSFLSTFQVPKFIVERTKTPGGTTILKEVNTQTQGKVLNPRMNTLTTLQVNNKVAVKEEMSGSTTGPTYKHFEKRIDVPNADIVRGAITGKFKFVDDGDDLISGETWYYRIRAYFGNQNQYLSDDFNDPEKVKDSELIKPKLSSFVLRTGSDLSPPSQVVVGVVPDVSLASNGFNAYEAVKNAVKAGILLNFEMPRPPRGVPDSARPPTTRAPYTRTTQRTGWGTLGFIGNEVGILKKAYPSTNKLKNTIFLEQIVRRVTNTALADLYSKPELMRLLADKWVGPNANTNQQTVTFDSLNSTPDSVSAIVDEVLKAQFDWTFFGITGTLTEKIQIRINNEYLAKEDSYSTTTAGNTVPKGKQEQDDGVTTTVTLDSPDPDALISSFQNFDDAVTPEGVQTLETSVTIAEPGKFFDGPPPLAVITEEERQALVEFLRIALIPMGGESGYLSWYGFTIGDIFPYLEPFLFDLEQWLKSLLRALGSAIQELIDIIEAILQKIRVLEQIIEIIIQIIDLLNISIRVSVLTYSSSNSSASDLANQILTSENKPSDSPFGLHSGIVLTAGGPGQGFVKALEALFFILSLPVKAADATGEELEKALNP